MFSTVLVRSQQELVDHTTFGKDLLTYAINHAKSCEISTQIRGSPFTPEMVAQPNQTIVTKEVLTKTK